MSIRLWLIWPMAVFYGFLLGHPRNLSEWFLDTIIALVALMPPCALGYISARMEDH